MNIVLVESSLDYPEVHNADVYSIYRPVNKLLRILRALHIRLGILSGFRFYWLGDWKNKLDCYEKIAIFDSLLDDYPLDILKKNKKKIIFCYRNRIQHPITHSKMTRNPSILKNRYNCELWSYNKEDCDEYALNYYSQFHLITQEFVNHEYDIKSDAFFIGLDKGRMPLIMEIYRALLSRGMICDFRVIPRGSNYNEDEKKLLSSTITYNDVLQLVKGTRCVVDVVSGMNKGLTYRSLEAAILRKKLITNYGDITKEGYYTPDNVFVWGKDDPNKLKEFIESEYKETEVDVYKLYSFEAFCDTIFK